MQLTPGQQGYLDAVRAGVANAESFMAELTDYHGGEVKTEYLITVEIAKALLRVCPDVALEYLINQVKGHILVHDPKKKFTLGSRRFDVAVLDAVAPVFIVEIKIGVRRLDGELRKDLRKIVDYLDCLTPSYVARALGACVFQTHVEALKERDLERTKRRVHKLERKINDGLKAFTAEHPEFEFDWMPFQGPDERISDDEVIADVDWTPMLGRRGHATRYHAILVRRRPEQGPPASPFLWRR
jgi:hypothetical protein